MRALPLVDAPGHVTLLVLLGIPLLAVFTFVMVSQLQMEVQEEEGSATEAAWCEAAQQQGCLGADGISSLEDLAKQLAALARGNPRIIEFWLLRPDRGLVRHYLRRGQNTLGEGCMRSLPLRPAQNHEHAASSSDENPHGCIVLPVGEKIAPGSTLVLHTERDWAASGAGATRAIGRTAWRLFPVFGGFYLLLGVLLVILSRRARRWRERAAATERIEALGALADGINHEIRNPLNTVALSFQYLDRRGDAETKEVVRTAREQAERIRGTLDEFVRFTKLTHLNPHPTSLGDALQSAVEVLKPEAAARGVSIHRSGDAEMRADGEKITEALVSIGAFLVEHADQGGDVDLAIESTRREWRLRASAETPGLDITAMARIFDPYLKTRRSDVGRGLALARAVFQAHGGDLTAELRGWVLTLRGRGPKDPRGDI